MKSRKILFPIIALGMLFCSWLLYDYKLQLDQFAQIDATDISHLPDSKLVEQPTSHSRKIEKLKRVYKEIADHRNQSDPTEEAITSNVEWIKLEPYWSPNGFTREELIEILGQPYEQTNQEVSYLVQSPYMSYIAKYKISRGIVEAPNPRYDIFKNPTSEELIEGMSINYTNDRYIRTNLKHSDREFYNANWSLNNLLSIWEPNGIEENQLSEVFGDPDWKTQNALGYKFNTGKKLIEITFTIEDGKVWRVPKQRIDEND